MQNTMVFGEGGGLGLGLGYVLGLSPSMLGGVVMAAGRNNEKRVKMP